MAEKKPRSGIVTRRALLFPFYILYFTIFSLLFFYTLYTCIIHLQISPLNMSSYDTELRDFPNIFSLKGKVVVVTGGSRGLGLHAASGYDIYKPDPN